MCKILFENRDEIQNYCKSNALNCDKIYSFPRSYNDDVVFIQYVDPSEETRGMLDEKPATIVLEIYKHGGSLDFKQTEHTKKYLS